MDAQRKGPALREQRHGPGYSGKQLKPDYNPLAQAAAKTLVKELSIVMLAADRMAAGHGLAWSDYDRLDQAHQFIIRILAELAGREVMQ